MLKDEPPQNDFMGGWVVDTEPMTAYAWLLAFEGGVLEGSDYRFLTPNNIEAFTFLRELSETTCAWQTAGGDSIAAFANREAMFITASLEDLPDVARAFASASNTDIWKVIPFPVRMKMPVVYGSSYIVLNSTEANNLRRGYSCAGLDKEQDALWRQLTSSRLCTSTLTCSATTEDSPPKGAGGQASAAVDATSTGFMA
jgi:hypothetical protein